MAIAIQIAGPALIKVDTGGSHALEDLGYTRDGAMVRFLNYLIDVPSDDAGGESGPPADIEYLGLAAQVTLDFTKFDSAVAAKVASKTYGGTAGTPATPGLLMIGGGYSYRLVIVTASGPYNFPCVVFREPDEINRGTKYSTWRLEANAYKNPSTGVLWNATTT